MDDKYLKWKKKKKKKTSTSTMDDKYLKVKIVEWVCLTKNY